MCSAAFLVPVSIAGLVFFLAPVVRSVAGQWLNETDFIVSSVSWIHIYLYNLETDKPGNLGPLRVGVS